MCPDGVDATRFLRSHSSLGSEANHVADTIDFVASLPADDRIKVVQETYQSALIMAEGYNHELLKSEAEMVEEIQQALGETLPYHQGLWSLQDNVRDARPALLNRAHTYCTQADVIARAELATARLDVMRLNVSTSSSPVISAALM